MKNWNYATLSKTAKSFGGPEQMLSALKNTYGIRGAVIGAGITVGTVALYQLIKKILLSQKVILNEQEVNETEKKLIAEIYGFEARDETEEKTPAEEKESLDKTNDVEKTLRSN